MILKTGFLEERYSMLSERIVSDHEALSLIHTYVRKTYRCEKTKTLILIMVLLLYGVDYSYF